MKYVIAVLLFAGCGPALAQNQSQMGNTPFLPLPGNKCAPLIPDGKLRAANCEKEVSGVRPPPLRDGTYRGPK